MVDIPRPPPAPTTPVSFPFLAEDSEPNKGLQFCAVLCSLREASQRGSVCHGHSTTKLLRNQRDFSSGEQRPCCAGNRPRAPAGPAWAFLGPGRTARLGTPGLAARPAVLGQKHGTRAAPPPRATAAPAPAPPRRPRSGGRPPGGGSAARAPRGTLGVVGTAGGVPRGTPGVVGAAAGLCRYFRCARRLFPA